MNKTPTPRTRGHRWTLIRSAQLCREPLCRHCLTAGVVREAEEVDHIIALEFGGTDDDENLQSLCIPCHERKTALDRGYRVRTEFGADGLPSDPSHPWNAEPS